MGGEPSTRTEASGWEQALAVLREAPATLFAVLDAARAAGVRGLLQRSGGVHQSLYEGPQALELEEMAPYLLEVPRDSSLLEQLLQQGWGQSWGIFLASDAPFLEVRRQLRKHLMAEEEATGKRLYFRFYDPRALRVFLPVCTPQQAEQFYGPIQVFYAESREGEVLRFPRPAGVPARA